VAVSQRGRGGVVGIRFRLKKKEGRKDDEDPYDSASVVSIFSYWVRGRRERRGYLKRSKILGKKRGGKKGRSGLSPVINRSC